MSHVFRYRLILSDLHLGKGAQVPTSSGVDHEEFLYDEKLIEFLEFYSSGPFENESVEIVFNGDFLNLIHIDYKGHFVKALTESICLHQLQTIVKGHFEVFRAIGKFLSKPNKRVTYVIGNHDQGMVWPRCQQYLNEVIGHPLVYRHIAYYFEGVHVEHGHMLEVSNRWDPNKFFIKKGVVEPILNIPLGTLFFLEVVLKVKQYYPSVDKVRPFLMLAKWASVNKPITFFRSWYYALKFLWRLIHGDYRPFQVSIMTVIKSIWDNLFQLDLVEAAKKLLQEPDINIVVCGHNHSYEHRRWGNKQYLNSGTWTEVISLDVASLGRNTKLTYVELVWNDLHQRYNAQLKEWKGYHKVFENVTIG